MDDLSPEAIRAKVQARFSEMLAQGYGEDEIRAAMPKIQSQIQQRLDQRRNLETGTGPGPWRAGYRQAEAPTVPNLPPRESTVDQPEPSTFSRLNRLPGVADAFLGKVSDKLTLGLWPKFTDAVGLTSPEGREATYAQNPNAAALGTGTGVGASALAGPGRLVGSMVSQTARTLAPQLAGQLQGQLGTAAATGAMLGYAEDPTLEGAGGGAFAGTAGAAAGEALGAGARKIFGSRGGQARQLIESHGGEVGVTTPGRGGPFEGPLAGRKPIDRDIGEVSRASGARVLNRMESDLEGDLAPALAQKAALDAANKGHVVVNDLVTKLEDLKMSERLTPGERSTVDGWLRRLDRYEVKLGGQGTGVYAMPPKQLNDFRGMLQDSTGVGGVPDSVAAAKMQGASGAAKELVDQTPYAQVNEAIAGARGQYEQGRRLLGLADRPAGGAMAPEGVPESDLAKLANTMSREEQNTVTAGLRNADRFKQFAQQNPQHRADIELPRVLEAKGDLSFRLSPGERHGLIERTKGALTGPAALASTGYLAAKAAGLPAETTAALAGGAKLTSDLLRLNAPAIQGRLLYGPAQAAQTAGLTLQQNPSLIPLLRALQEERERGRKRAEKLKGGRRQ